MLGGSKNAIIALITGGAQGLGASTARRLVAYGARVCVADVKCTTAIVKELGDRCIGVSCDVTDPMQVSAAVDKCVDHFGGLTDAVQCAGIVEYSQTLAPDGTTIDLGVFDKVMKINMYGALHLAKFASAAIAKGELDDRKFRGSILFTSSICATGGQATNLPYSVSKAAINGMVLPMARDLSHCGIRVNAIAPGTMPTAMQLDAIKLCGSTTPEEIREFQEAFILKNYPEGAEQGREEDFAHLAHTFIENPYLNGSVMRLDGAMRM